MSTAMILSVETSNVNSLPELQRNIQSMIETMTKRYVDREIFARFDVFLGQVYEEFVCSVHVVPQSLCLQKFENGDFVHVEEGKEWGFTNPEVNLIGCHDGQRRTMDR